MPTLSGTPPTAHRPVDEDGWEADEQVPVRAPVALGDAGSQFSLSQGEELLGAPGGVVCLGLRDRSRQPDRPRTATLCYPRGPCRRQRPRRPLLSAGYFWKWLSDLFLPQALA